MPVHIGTLGRLVKLPYVVSQSVTPDERYSFQTTLEGRRKAQPRPVGRRTWSLSTDHFRPNEHSLLSQFTDGAWGPGPFVFVSTDAPHTNMLSPADSLCLEPFPGTPVTAGGPVLLDDGSWAPASWASDGTGSINFNYQMVPVISGQVVTGSCWLKGLNGSVRIYFYGQSGEFLEVTAASPTGNAMTYNRSTVSATVPAGAVSARVGATSAVGASRPAFTWTESVQPWSVGEGCPKAVVSGFSREQVKSVIDHTYSNVSFTVTEVG